MSISLDGSGGLVIPSSWCESVMAENTTCTCTWPTLYPVNEALLYPNTSLEDAERHDLSLKLSLKLDSWLEGVLLPIIATIGTIGIPEISIFFSSSTHFTNFYFYTSLNWILKNIRMFRKLFFIFLASFSLFILGNIVSILVLTNKDIDLKPSFVNILICLVSP